MRRSSVHGEGGNASLPEELNDRRGAQKAVFFDREKGAVGRFAIAPTSAAHPLHERGDSARSVNLEHMIQIADVDAELKRAGRDDHAVLAFLKCILGGLALLER